VQQTGQSSEAGRAWQAAAAWGTSARLGRRPKPRLVPSASPTEPVRTGIDWGTATADCSTCEEVRGTASPPQADSAVAVTGHCFAQTQTAGLRDLPALVAQGGLAANAHFQAAATIQLPETALSKASTEVVYIHVPV